MTYSNWQIDRLTHRRAAEVRKEWWKRAISDRAQKSANPQVVNRFFASNEKAATKPGRFEWIESAPLNCDFFPGASILKRGGGMKQMGRDETLYQAGGLSHELQK